MALSFSVLRPIRLDPYEPPDAELEIINRYHGWTKDNGLMLKPVEEILAYLATNPTLSYQDINILVAHPSERVSLALLDQQKLNGEQIWHSSNLPRLRGRVMAYWSQPDAYAWFPLADRLAVYGQLDNKEIEEANRVLGQWFEAEGSQVIPVLQNFKAQFIQDLLIKHPERFTLDQFCAWYRQATSPVREQIAYYSKSAPSSHIAVQVEEAFSNIGPLPDDTNLSLSALRILSTLGKSGQYTPDASVKARLINRVAEPLAASTTSPVSHALKKRAESKATFDYLMQYGQLTDEELWALHEIVTPARAMVSAILTHPSTTSALKTHIARQSLDPTILTILFKSMSTDQVFRHKLDQLGVPHLLKALCLNATTSEFNSIYPRLAKANLKHALEVLEEATFPPNAQIDQRIFKKYLLSDKEEVRTRAIRAMSRLPKIANSRTI